MSLRGAFWRLVVALVATWALSIATTLPRPWGSLAWVAFVPTVLYAVACVWRCDRIAGRR